MGEAARKRIGVDEFLVRDDGTDRRCELLAGDLEASDRLQRESIGFDIAVEALYDGLDFTASEAGSG